MILKHIPHLSFLDCSPNDQLEEFLAIGPRPSKELVHTFEWTLSGGMGDILASEISVD